MRATTIAPTIPPAANTPKAAAAYGEHFSDPDGKVRATIEIIWLTAWAPHESQQQPATSSAKGAAMFAVQVRAASTALPPLAEADLVIEAYAQFDWALLDGARP